MKPVLVVMYMLNHCVCGRQQCQSDSC